MANVLIVYGSTTGNTRTAAEMIEQVLAAKGTVTVLDVTDAKADGLCDGKDLVLFGCSTWGDDEIELQGDFIPFFEEFDSLGASGKKVAVFGCGETGYTYFCGAVDEIEAKLKELGAVIVAEGLKIDGDPGSEKQAIEAWAAKVATAL